MIKFSSLLCDIVLAFIDSCVVWWISFNIHTRTHTNTPESSEYDETLTITLKDKMLDGPSVEICVSEV